MKKEYKAPLLSIVNTEVESPLMSESTNPYDWGQSKKNGRTFVDDEEEAPAAAPKKFWDDED